jgi:hypothetical protein
MGTPGYSRGTARVTVVQWLLRHGRGAARAVPSCAGAYVSGAAGSNVCPAGSVRIEAEAACRTAAAAVGKTIRESIFLETASDYPRGCYYFTTGNCAYFNTHAVGAGRSTSQLLCAAMTTGAPLKRRRRTGACTGARACRHRACTAQHSRAVCIIRGRQIDARTWTKRVYIHVYIDPYDADGARRRCRAAHGSAGGRRKGTALGRAGYSWLVTMYSWVLIWYSRGTQMGRSRRAEYGCGAAQAAAD